MILAKNKGIAKIAGPAANERDSEEIAKNRGHRQQAIGNRKSKPKSKTKPTTETREARRKAKSKTKPYHCGHGEKPRTREERESEEIAKIAKIAGIHGRPGQVAKIEEQQQKQNEPYCGGSHGFIRVCGVFC